MDKKFKVSFRLPSRYADVLQKKADQENISPHQLARLSLVREMESTVLRDVKDQMLAVRAELGLLKSMLRNPDE